MIFLLMLSCIGVLLVDTEPLPPPWLLVLAAAGLLEVAWLAALLWASAASVGVAVADDASLVWEPLPLPPCMVTH